MNPIARAARVIAHPDKQTGPKADALLTSFGKAIASRRLHFSMGQVKLASSVGCSVGQISNMEAGRNWPSMPVYVKLCRVLKVATPPFLK